MGLGAFFKKIGSFISKIWGAAEKLGLTDELVKIALGWVKVADEKYVDNAEKREWVVGILKAKGIPESIARLAVELAVRAFKSELDKLTPSA